MSVEMKDSGIDWIGEIPKHWEIEKPKNMFSLRKTKGNKEAVLLAATQKYGMYPQSQLDGVVKVSADTDLQSFKTVHRNDYVISLRSFQGGFEMSDYEGVCTPAYQVFFATTPINHRYYKFLFKTEDFVSKLNSFTIGIREGKNIQYEDFARLTSIPVPQLNEQSRIANFLDKKSAEIDELIALQEQMIAQLNTYKQAVITEIVTKGLDPNVKMKDSGVEWIGEIPEHWDVCRLKYLTNGNLQYGANESGVTYDANLPRYVRITDILDNTLREDITKLSLTEEQAKDYILQNNDLLFARSGATVGKAFIYDELYGRCAFAGYLIRASINNENSAKFVYYYTQTSMYEEWKKQVFVQATIQNIGADKYAQLPIVTPLLSEQQSIAQYLDQKCKEIDELISIKKEKIEHLKAYKKSVIYEYVTGKKHAKI